MVEFDCIRCGKHNFLCDCEFNEEMFEMLIDSCGFDTLIYLGKKMLDRHYPESIFTGTGKGSGPEYIVALREALEKVINDLK